MGAKLASIASSLPFAHLLGMSENKQAAAGNRSLATKRRTEALPTAAEQLDAAALSQATSAAVAAERVRWSEIMAVGMAVGMGAYAVHLAKSDMSAKDAISKLQKAKADTDKTAPRKLRVEDGWLAEKARQAAEGRPTPMQIHVERIRRINAQGNAK